MAFQSSSKDYARKESLDSSDSYSTSDTTDELIVSKFDADGLQPQPPNSAKKSTKITDRTEKKSNKSYIESKSGKKSDNGALGLEPVAIEDYETPVKKETKSTKKEPKTTRKYAKATKKVTKNTNEAQATKHITKGYATKSKLKTDSDSYSANSSSDKSVIKIKQETLKANDGANTTSTITLQDISSSSDGDHDEIIKATLSTVNAEKCTESRVAIASNDTHPERIHSKDSNDCLEIYCGGLPFKMTQEEVRELFESDCGPIVRVHLLPRRGIAFITFKTTEGLEKALEYNETLYMGRTLKINKTIDRPKNLGGATTYEVAKTGTNNIVSKEVCIRNLSYYTTEEDMHRLFSECGEVVRCFIPKFEDTGKSTGRCFIEFTTHEGAARAVEYDNTDIDGRTVSIQFANPRPSKRTGATAVRGGGIRGGRIRGGGFVGSRGGGHSNFQNSKPQRINNSNNSFEKRLRIDNGMQEHDSPKKQKSIIFEDSD